jgi:hypothetical protein
MLTQPRSEHALIDEPLSPLQINALTALSK